MQHGAKGIKRYLPSTLFGRAFLILIIPAILVQLLVIYQFYERHWDSVVRNMSTSLAGEVELLYRLAESGKLAQLEQTAQMLGFTYEIDRQPRTVVLEGKGKDAHPEFYKQLSRRITTSFMVEQYGRDEDLRLTLLLEDSVLRLFTTKKRLVSSTTYIFLLWTAGFSLVLLVIATAFLRNQIRPIRRLAKAAEQFGLGLEDDEFQPRGASEVRQAGRAFLIMKNRIQRQIRTRTEMLAGISHDLRTPLTRMKLQLAMLPIPEKDQQQLGRDISEMEHMVEEYLQFAKRDNQEASETVIIETLIEEVTANYQRAGKPVEYKKTGHTPMMIRPKAIKRALQNLIDNALRYGNEAKVATQRDGAYQVITVRDKGPGIPESAKDEVFRPFTRLDRSRNLDHSGVGLGLTICKDIIQAHGGTIELRNNKKGLEVAINLPLYGQ